MITNSLTISISCLFISGKLSIFTKLMTARNIYRMLYILIGVVGLLIQLGVLDGGFNPTSLVYYTVLSNILCVVYFILRTVYDNKPVIHPGAFRRFIMSADTKYSVTMCIMLTFLIYHFLLAPSGDNAVNTFSQYSVSNYILHYIIPLMTLLDFLVFDKNAPKLRKSDPFNWLVIPAAYLVFILVRAPLFGNIGQTSSPYPYFFMDFSVQPVSSVLMNLFFIVIIFIVLGYVLLFLDLISRKVCEAF